MGTWLMPKGVGCALGRLTGRSDLLLGLDLGLAFGLRRIDPEDLGLLAAPLLLREEVVHGARLLHPV